MNIFCAIMDKNVTFVYFSQLEEAKRIEMLSEKALETSNEALRLAIETFQMPGNILLEIQELRNK